jgi:DNA-directed RNA polymerase specialized sigma subunit
VCALSSCCFDGVPRKGFEIAAFSQDLLDKYSQRSAQRDAAIQEFTNSRGRAPTDNEVALLLGETRADKLQEISTDRVPDGMTSVAQA